MTDRHLQADFLGKIFNIEGIKRECYYCTMEDGGAWIWLHTNINDKCKRINFVVLDEYNLERLHNQIANKEEILLSDYGYLSKQY